MVPTDEYWMRRALELATQARGRTSPNPLVGAVVVKDGRLVGSGYHQQAGGPHAEVLALGEAGEAAAGADLYVTLEPCAHYGRTPPCTDTVLAAGVSRVVAAMIDPNPCVAGKGVDRLRQAGVHVEVGVLAAEAERLNRPYITYIREHRSHVLWKVAATLDGKSATHTGQSRWITGPEARSLVHKVRSEVDAIMVGIGTVLHDDPALTARPAGLDPSRVPQPLRLVVDSRLRLPLSARCIDPQAPGRAIVATTDLAPARKVRELQARGVDVWQGPPLNGRVDMPRLLHDLAELELVSLLLEGGATLAGELFDRQLIDACMCFIAPSLFGGASALPVLGGAGVADPARAPRLVDTTWRRVGDDFLIEGTILWQQEGG